VSSVNVERARHALLPRAVFLQRLARNAALGFALILASLLLGAAGYHFFAGLAWIDAFLNAAMILTGMGPVDPLPTPASKVFATCYALFSGVAFLTIIGVILAPVVHRFLHRFHFADEDAGGKAPSGSGR